MNLTAQQLQTIFINMIILIVSVALHEFGHAQMATWMGDDTPRRQGRVTLNPLAHADPIGTFALPLVSALMMGGGYGIGWGKPVQWQPHRINRKWKMWQAVILVSIAGPLMNLLLGTVFVVTHIILIKTGVATGTARIDDIIYGAATINFILFFFNLVPCPPLDGGHVAEALTPYRHRAKWREYVRFSPFVFLALFCIPQVQQIFVIPAVWCRDHLYLALIHHLL